MRNKYFRPEISNSDSEKISILRLARSHNIGPVTFLKLINKFSKPSDAIYAAQEILKKKNEKLFSEKDALQELENCEKQNAKIISIFDDNYPTMLSEIYDPPAVLTVKGDVKKLKELNKTVGIVGARYASANAVSLSYKFSKELAEKNVTVISGLAKGIDTGSHKGALMVGKNNVPTIAVIAGGIDNIYPIENEKLYNEIAEKGLVISENAFGHLPKAESFPRRNRIISGLSQAVLVVEAALKSGSLITARFALEHGRELCCIPGFPLDPRSEGTNLLIKKGANLITSTKDILELIESFDLEEHKAKNFFAEDEFDDVAQPDNQEISENSIDENNLLSIISGTPVAVDDLIKIYKFSPAELNAKLLEFEILGEITRHPGNKVARAS